MNMQSQTCLENCVHSTVWIVTGIISGALIGVVIGVKISYNYSIKKSQDRIYAGQMASIFYEIADAFVFTFLLSIVGAGAGFASECFLYWLYLTVYCY